LIAPAIVPAYENSVTFAVQIPQQVSLRPAGRESGQGIHPGIAAACSTQLRNCASSM
jgi:hypothetical protein